MSGLVAAGLLLMFPELLSFRFRLLVCLGADQVWLGDFGDLSVAVSSCIRVNTICETGSWDVDFFVNSRVGHVSLRGRSE